MSGMEIERKFLVDKSVDFSAYASSVSHIQQGYIPADGATVRIRVREKEAFLTIKSRSHDGGLSRYEFEHAISLEEATQLLRLCKGGVIDKHRYLIEYEGHTFEVDVFHGENEGLVMAEVELSSPDESFGKPSFLLQEVTGNRRFYNSHLLEHPFSTWKELLPPAFQ